MQPHVYEDKESTPGFVGRCVDKLLLGASHFSLKAESSGNLYLKLQGQMSFRFDDAKFPEGRFFLFSSFLSSMSMCLKLEERSCASSPC